MIPVEWEKLYYLFGLYDCFQSNGQEAWEQVSLTLSNQRNFNIDYFYNKMSESDNGQAERKVIWAYNIFGFTPKEGNYTRKILEYNKKGK